MNSAARNPATDRYAESSYATAWQASEGRASQPAMPFFAFAAAKLRISFSFSALSHIRVRGNGKKIQPFKIFKSIK